MDFGDVLRIVTSDSRLHLREHGLDTKQLLPSVAFAVLPFRDRSCHRNRLGWLQAWIWDAHAHKTLNTFWLSDPKLVIPVVGP